MLKQIAMQKDLPKTRSQYRCIWQSSYDRGLEHLLKIWPDVKKEVPEAELHVFYGWTLFEKFYRDNPERMAWKAKIDKMMEYDGIIHHGRVSQKDIQEWVEVSGIWPYPTHFGEISCISAMRCQVGGAIPVVVEYAALETTSQFGVKIKGDIYDPKVRAEFTEELISLLKDEDRQKKIRKEMIPWATEWFTWKRVAKQWSNLFKGKEVKPLVPNANKKEIIK